MNYRLLISGERGNFTQLIFDPRKEDLRAVAEYPSPFNVSWAEHTSSQGQLDQLVGLSEGLCSGFLFTFEIDNLHETCKITSQQTTLGAPAHFITLQDKSALAVATYLGGSVTLCPISITENDGLLLTGSPRSDLLLEFSYKSVVHGPDHLRQRRSHIHQILENTPGLLFAPDLGSDRVWILHREEMNLELCGWLQCPPGTGPRHAVLSPDETIIYVLGELSHTVIAFDMLNCPAENIQPINGFSATIIHASVQPGHRTMMDSAELILHPGFPNVLYASNRWERHIAQREPNLEEPPTELPLGDAIAIILLSDDGKKVQNVDFVRTGLDVIRGMRLSNDGKYVVVAGQEGGGVEVYSICGVRGELWTLVARLSRDLEKGIKHAIWM